MWQPSYMVPRCLSDTMCCCTVLCCSVFSVPCLAWGVQEYLRAQTSYSNSRGVMEQGAWYLLRITPCQTAALRKICALQAGATQHTRLGWATLRGMQCSSSARTDENRCRLQRCTGVDIAQLLLYTAVNVHGVGSLIKALPLG